MKGPPSIHRLMRAEVYASARWWQSGSGYWYALAVKMNKAVKNHPDYKGAK